MLLYLHIPKIDHTVKKPIDIQSITKALDKTQERKTKLKLCNFFSPKTAQ